MIPRRSRRRRVSTSQSIELAREFRLPDRDSKAAGTRPRQSDHRLAIANMLPRDIRYFDVVRILGFRTAPLVSVITALRRSRRRLGTIFSSFFRHWPPRDQASSANERHRAARRCAKHLSTATEACATYLFSRHAPKWLRKTLIH